MIKRWALMSAATLLTTFMAGSGFAAQERFAGDVVQVLLDGQVHNTTLSVAGPEGYYAQVFAKTGIPMIKLSRFGSVPDGVYNWQVTAATSEMLEVRDNSLNSGRDGKTPKRMNKGTTESGMFRVKNGAILPKSDEIEQ